MNQLPAPGIRKGPGPGFQRRIRAGIDLIDQNIGTAAASGGQCQKAVPGIRIQQQRRVQIPDGAAARNLFHRIQAHILPNRKAVHLPQALPGPVGFMQNLRRTADAGRSSCRQSACK